MRGKKTHLESERARVLGSSQVARATLSGALDAVQAKELRAASEQAANRTAQEEKRRPSIARLRAQTDPEAGNGIKIVNDFGSWLSRGWCRVEAMARLLSKRSGPIILIQSSEASLELMSPHDAWSNQPGMVSLERRMKVDREIER